MKFDLREFYGNLSPAIKWQLGFLLLFLLLSPLAIIRVMVAPAQDVSSSVSIEIKPGTGTNNIAYILKKAGVIRSENGFILWSMISGKSRDLQAGEYELDPSNNIFEIVSMLSSGRVKLWPVTVPEGLTITETAKVIASAGFSDEKSIIEAAKNREILSRFMIKGKSAEGYLFPESYRFRKGVTAERIIEKMITTFFEKIGPIKEKYQPYSDLSFEEIITLASIIEKETASDDEYNLVSAVYNNRLKKNMKLQADPTVIYGLPDFDGNIRKKDLQYDSPYNTYLYTGLPPGPIANPGIKAITSAYTPSKVSYIYFVATKAEGKHVFSNTLREHVNAVNKYQKKRRKQ
ncbi:MAG: endolytic transglycosylase MltG [Nitrospinota bacterium]|nr:endolytic transglycosylase MltG [Nitrospinota bacterium]